MKIVNLKEFVAKYGPTKVFVDKSFQRNQVWTSEERHNYIESLYDAHAHLQNIVLAHIPSCLDYCERIGCDKSIAYYSKWHKKGYTHIVLDGQNRTVTLLAFYNSDFEISADSIRDADGKECKVDNKFFKDLPERLRDQARTGSKISIMIVEEATRGELTKIFRKLQMGLPLNDQEKRNSSESPIAEWIREMGDKHVALSSRYLKEQDRKRMADEEMIVKFSMHLIEEYRTDDGLKPANNDQQSFSAKALTAWYDMGASYNTLSDETSPYISSELRRVESILETMEKVITKQKVYPHKSRVVRKGLIWATLMACEYVYDNDLLISDYVEFFKALKEIDDWLITDSEEERTRQRLAAMGNSEDPDDVKEDHFYYKWANLPHKVRPRKKRTQALVAKLQTNHQNLTLRKKAAEFSQAA
tara:strand:- start:87 stop:1334 length:1248 start_codon:yes stop_codon:yes gene_type:complete